MFIPDLQVVLVSNLFAVAHPLANGLSRESFFHFRLPGGSEVLKDTWPDLQLSGSDEARHLLAEICIGEIAESNQM